MAQHPLSVRASWRLSTGAPGMPGIQRVVLGLLVLSALMCVAWAAAVVHEAIVWGVSPWLLLGASTLAAVWVMGTLRTWQRWRVARQALTLQWGGPVRKSSRHEPACGGFAVQQWQAPVHIRVAIDWQRWMLLHLRATTPAGRQAWIWVDAHALAHTGGAHSPASGHRLRTLLYLPRSMNTLDACLMPSPEPATQSKATPVASWAHIVNLGATLRRFVLPASGAAPTAARAASAESPDSLFPPTQLMPDAASRVGVSAGMSAGIRAARMNRDDHGGSRS